MKPWPDYGRPWRGVRCFWSGLRDGPSKKLDAKRRRLRHIPELSSLRQARVARANFCRTREGSNPINSFREEIYPKFIPEFKLCL